MATTYKIPERAAPERIRTRRYRSHPLQRPGVSPRKQYIRLVILGFGVLGLAAAFIDLNYLRRQRLPVRLSETAEVSNLLDPAWTNRYHDAGGLFSMAWPQGWKAVRRPAGTPYTVALRSPNGPEINVVASVVDFDYPGLKREVYALQKQMGLNMYISETNFLGRPALLRVMNLNSIRMVIYDFVEGGVAHNIQVCIPQELVAKYEAPLREAVTTYQPRLAPAPAPAPRP